MKMSSNTNTQFDIMDITTKFKELKSIDDLDFSDMEKYSRGITPSDIQDICLNLCKDYLSGNWSQQTVDTIEVRRVKGGLVNQIYYCAIRQPNNKENVPQEVALRFYGDSPFDPNDKQRVRDLVTSLVFSEKKVGYKIYGMFESGQIQKYYKHRLFKGDDQKNQVLVSKVFRTLAQIHSWQVPISKTSKVIFEMVFKSYEEVFKKHSINQLSHEFNCETLKKYDLKTELNWIKETIEGLNSPVVFTHNDFRSSNLLITEPNDELVVCDYDLASYGYRGFDFAWIIREWGRGQFDLKTIDGIPLGSEFRPCIEIYVEECKRIYGKSYSKNPINSVDHILKEAKIFLMFSYLFMAVWLLKALDGEEGSPMSRIQMEWSELNYKNYHKIKEILNEQDIFNSIYL